ncbi:hypothetical protein FRC11_009021, partial [Ceratobasidium sp. 423]
MYLSGHTETQIIAELPSGQLAYAPADYLDTSPSGQSRLIPYETMRPWLLNDRHSAPLIFITEVSFCENFLQLPYVLEYDGSEARWAQTGYPEVSTGNSREIVHFAATAPGEQSIAFGVGAVFTKAFYSINPSKALSLKDIAQKLRGNVNTILSSIPGTRHSQLPKVYSSRIMDEPHFFATLGFCSSYPAVETDLVETDSIVETVSLIETDP